MPSGLPDLLSPEEALTPRPERRALWAREARGMWVDAAGAAPAPLPDLPPPEEVMRRVRDGVLPETRPVRMPHSHRRGMARERFGLSGEGGLTPASSPVSSPAREEAPRGEDSWDRLHAAGAAPDPLPEVLEGGFHLLGDLPQDSEVNPYPLVLSSSWNPLSEQDGPEDDL